MAGLPVLLLVVCLPHSDRVIFTHAGVACIDHQESSVQIQNLSGGVLASMVLSDTGHADVVEIAGTTVLTADYGDEVRGVVLRGDLLAPTSVARKRVQSPHEVIGVGKDYTLLVATPRGHYPEIRPFWTARLQRHALRDGRLAWWTRDGAVSVWLGPKERSIEEFKLPQPPVSVDYDGGRLSAVYGERSHYSLFRADWSEPRAVTLDRTVHFVRFSTLGTRTFLALQTADGPGNEDQHLIVLSIPDSGEQETVLDVKGRTFLGGLLPRGGHMCVAYTMTDERRSHVACFE